MKIQVKGFIYASQEVWETAPNFTFFTFENAGAHYAMICPHTLEFEPPEGYSFEKAKIDALVAKKEDLTHSFHKSIAEINEQISKFQCLEMTS